MNADGCYEFGGEGVMKLVKGVNLEKGLLKRLYGRVCTPVFLFSKRVDLTKDQAGSNDYYS